jgi:hypothetical protein
MSKNRDKAAAPDQQPHPMGSVAAYVAGGVIGLLILLGLANAFKKEPAKGPIEELPHLAIMVEFEDLSEPALRSGLLALQRDIGALNLASSGPANYPILVPGASPGDAPIPRTLDELSADELTKAAPYLAVGGWLVPRVFAPDLKSAVIRVGPPGQGNFPSGTREEIGKIIERYAHLGKISAYSQALGMNDEADRARINLVFGVQTVNLFVRSTSGPVDGPEQLKGMLVSVEGLQSTPIASRHLVRSVTSPGTWVLYAGTVQTQAPIDTAVFDLGAIDGYYQLGKKLKVPLNLSQSGQVGIIEVTTEAEGAANLDLAYEVAGNLPRQGGNLNTIVGRQRPIRTGRGCSLISPR